MNLDELALAVSKCREGWKSQSGRYPDCIWDMALSLIYQKTTGVKQVSEVIKVQSRTVVQRLQKSTKRNHPVKAGPKFLELGSSFLADSIAKYECLPESTKPHLEIESSSGAKLRAHLPLEPSVKLQSLMQKLVSCWVLAHR
ncbi:MAG: hypothetical protein H3C47_12935 [Candidatus Cloacimonetes bacterium]|nr:hypothetical protein [Candidatus Cloacimonadota bacterium]